MKKIFVLLLALIPVISFPCLLEAKKKTWKKQYLTLFFY
jgi:hypothetical protein